MEKIIYSDAIFGKNFLSEEFSQLMHKKLNEDLFRQLKLKDPKHNIILRFDTRSAYIGDFEINGSSWRMVQKLRLELIVNNHGFFVWIVWRMKDWEKRHVRPFHTNFNSEDIEMFFEALPVEKILKEYYKKPPEFQSDLSKYKFVIEVDHFFVDTMYLVIIGNPDRFDEINKLLSNKIKKWNIKSESDKRKQGVFHHSKVESIKDKTFIYYLDSGSVGEAGIVYLLDSLDGNFDIESVKITSFI